MGISHFCIQAESRDLRNPADRALYRELGVKEISISHLAFMKPEHTRDSAKELRELLAADGLTASTCHPPFGSFNGAFSPLRQSPKGRADDLAWMKEFIIRCGLTGVRAIPLHTGGGMLPDAKDWETESVRQYVAELLPTAEEAGVILAIENTNHATPTGFYPGVDGPVALDRNLWKFDDTEKILDFVHGFSSPFVRICYDVGHSHLLGRMKEDLDAFLPDTVMFHLHDNDGVGNDAHIQPGYGNADWRAVFAAIGTMPQRPVLYVEAGPYMHDLSLMVRELSALEEGRVTVKPGGFLEKDEDTGRIVITEASEREDV